MYIEVSLINNTNLLGCLYNDIEDYLVQRDLIWKYITSTTLTVRHFVPTHPVSMMEINPVYAFEHLKYATVHSRLHTHV